MKKVAVVFILLLFVGVGLCTGSAYWFGTETERQYHQIVDDLLGQYKDDVKIVSESYSRGVFTSKGDTVVEFTVHIPAWVSGGCCEEIKTVRVLLSHEISHGPLPMSADNPFGWKPAMGVVKTRLSLAPETRQQFKDIALPEGFLLTAHTVFYMEGNGRSRIVLPPFINSFSGVQTDWSGLTANVTFARGFASVEGSFDAPSLTVTEEKETAQIKNIASSFLMTRSTGTMMLSDFSLTFGRIALPAPDGNALYSLEGIGWHFTNRESGPTLTSNVAVRFDTLKVGQDGYGPGAFELEFRNIDRAACLKFQEEMRNMPRGSTDDA
ncbi:MAG: DUF945 family protein, partial [Acidobacteriota bacterium]